uniref:E3 ubiquitin-protein ligase UBR7 n=2 Tax=Hirondellea gigas TaxID=1518452 RepID=A0A6A7G3Y7_9CRUS
MASTGEGGSEEYDDSSLTMMDILEEQEALQEDAEAVLGASDADHCTYDKGYMVRQAVYACLTCSPVGGAGGRAGVCLACSLHCHNNHTLVELYTKRNFKCDCGNSNILMTTCKLQPGKSAINPDNKYSQNFDGLYCVCHRPYPDTEQPESQDDEMIQCCCCEDWYHSQHLGNSSVPTGDQYAEMICSACVKKLTFLHNYASLAVTVMSKSDLDTSVDVESSGDSTAVADNVMQKTEQKSESTKTEVSGKKAYVNGSGSSTTTNDQQNGQRKNKETKENTGDSTKDNITNGKQNKVCSAGQFKGAVAESEAMFFPEDWRSKLCTCDTCKVEYSRLEASYLTNSEDTISHYEYLSRQRVAGTGRQLSVEREIDALNSVDRVTRTEMVTEYNTLSTELREYLRKFADTGKVVRDEDIKEFFAGLQARKKQRTMDGVPPNACRW